MAMTQEEQDLKAGRKRAQKQVAGAPLASAKPAPVTPASRRVRAKAAGHHGHTLRAVGDVFHIGPDEKLGSWMELWPEGSTQAPSPPDPDSVVDAPEETSAFDRDVI